VRGCWGGFAWSELAKVELPELEQLERIVGVPAADQCRSGTKDGVGDLVDVPGLTGYPEGLGEVARPVHT